MNTSKLQSIFLAAVLVFGAASAALVVPQKAFAVVTITASAESFYGPGFIRVLITDTAFDESGDTIFPTIEARDGNTVLDSVDPEIESIGTSGQFELFITTSTTPLVPNSPTKRTVVDNPGNGWENGPFIIRTNAGETTGDLTPVAGGALENANGGLVTFGSNDIGLDVDMDAEDGDNFRIIYGGQSLVIDFNDSTAELTADRTEAGEDDEIILSIIDQDANLDPTLIDILDTADFAALADLLDSTNALDITNGEIRETGQNTGIFEFSAPITVDNLAAGGGGGGDDGTAANQIDATLPTGNSFTLTDHSVYRDDVAGAVAPFDDFDPTDDDDSVSLTLRNRDGAVSLATPPTIRDGLKPQITDADRNISTDDGDDITVASAAIKAFVDLNGNALDDDGVSANLAFTETDDSTGMFIPDYTQDKLRIQLGAAAAISGATGIITLTPDQIADGVDLIFVYTDPAFQSNSVFQLKTEVATTMGELSAENTTVSITDDAVITLTDPDLNTDPKTIQTYNVAEEDGEFLINGQLVGTLIISTSGEDDVLGGPGGVDATFIETGPNTGVFVADDIDVGDIDAAVGGLDDGEEINFEYNDILDDDDNDIDITVEIPDAGIDVDRNTVPVPTIGDPVTVVVSVIDPTANTNPGSVQTIIIDFDNGGASTDAGIKVRDGDGASFNSEDDAGDVEDLTGIAGDITLTETGPNTGIFEEDVDLEPDIADIDRLIDTRVTFEYDGETVSVTYRAFDGRITVDPAVAGPGGIVTVTVVDSDGNRDPDEEDELEVDFETDEDTDDGAITLTETGPNTGIFTEEVELGVDIDVSEGNDFSTEITFTYTDAITSAGDEDEDREATVRIATSTGALLVEPEVVGPGTEITLTLIDTDLNKNPNGIDRTNTDFPAADQGIVELRSSDGNKAEIDFEETGPNTGIFEATIQFEPRDQGEDGEATAGDGTDDMTYTVLPGDVLSFRYEDESSQSGSSTIVSFVIEIMSEDPTMTTAQPTVQVGGTIALTIEDSDANRDADSLDSVDVDITSDSDPVGFTLAALETGDNTGIFTVNIPTSQTVSSGSVTVKTGDDVMLEYNDEFPADYADRVETVLDPSKDFVLVVPVGQRASDTSATTAEAPVLKNISGDEISEVTVGQQVILSVDINNNNDFDQEFAGIVEVRDADGFTVYLQWQTGTLPGGGEVNIGLSFVPTEPGDYTVRTFVLSSIQSPAALSPIATSTFTVS